MFPVTKTEISSVFFFFLPCPGMSSTRPRPSVVVADNAGINPQFSPPTLITASQPEHNAHNQSHLPGLSCLLCLNIKLFVDQKCKLQKYCSSCELWVRAHHTSLGSYIFKRHLTNTREPAVITWGGERKRWWRWWRCKYYLCFAPAGSNTARVTNL